MKVAFTPFVDPNWTGGVQYLRNLFAALAELPGRPVEPVLFLPPGPAPDAVNLLRPLIGQDPVVVSAWAGKRYERLLSAMVTGRDYRSEEVFRAAGIDLVFENDVWFGRQFGLPTLAWIADFQHCYLPHLFSRWQRYKRSGKYRAYCQYASAVMVSSEDGRRDCERFFPQARGRVHAVPFAVQLNGQLPDFDASDLTTLYGLPQKYFYLPAQMWRHKNHACLIEALRLLKARGQHVVVAASGNAVDVFRPDYPKQVLQTVEREGLQSSFVFLGHIPHAHIMPMMRGAAAVLNPSLFEGWSTTVEEAKAIGVPLVLSGLRVHREQAPAEAYFFDPNSAENMADVLQTAWSALMAGPRTIAEQSAAHLYQGQRASFACRFVDVARLAVANFNKEFIL